jgi:sialic acid synthase SpsE/mannose-6-phosphate isomerase-like protein (cupin superfamily)
MTKPLIIFEMANNHMGDLDHGKVMIEQFADVINKYISKFDFAWKFQFRDFNTFIHKDYKNRMDHKYVKRFTETSLTKEQFSKLKLYAEQKGFKTLCTGFDENSIDLITEMKFDIIKVASCSFTDWPLLNKIVETDKPIILSTAGASLDEIDRVVSFMQHRNKDISLMHCVGEYPTQPNNLQLNQIDLLKNRYPNISIGYSTHEEPNEFDAIQIAIGKGINISEKHIAVATEKYPPNAYSVTPEQMDCWLEKASKALVMCGSNEKVKASEKELSDLLQFKRGMFVKNKIIKGSIIDKKDMYFAWPNIDNQVLANDASKYNQFVALEDIEADQPVMFNKISISNTREKVWNIVQDVKEFLSKTDVVYPGQAELEISHHYGIDKFYEIGITMITVVNREYCKKLIIVLPNQTHPEQYHHQKEETFVVLHGEVELTLNGVTQTFKKGDVITIEREIRHIFTTKTGCVIEEVSSTHYVNDSYYTDESIAKNKDRKTFVTHWL